MFYQYNQNEVTMDRQLREEIRQDVSRAINAALATMQEQWLSADDLCKQFQMITPRLLKYHGDIFPRKKMKITGTNGKSYTTRWAYPRNEIAINIASGMYDDLKVLKDI